MHVLLTAHPQARTKFLFNVYIAKKTKCPHIFKNIRATFGESFVLFFFFLVMFFFFFWVFSECVTASYTYTRNHRMLSKSDQEKTNDCARVGSSHRAGPAPRPRPLRAWTPADVASQLRRRRVRRLRDRSAPSLNSLRRGRGLGAVKPRPPALAPPPSSYSG